MDITVSFSCEGIKGKLNVLDITDIDPTLDYSEVEAEGFDPSKFSRWSGSKATADDILVMVINAYLREDTTFSISGLDMFDEIIDSSEVSPEGSSYYTIFQYDYDRLEEYSLILATKDFLYYCGDDCYLMLDTKKHTIVTDMENFFNESLEEDMERIESGEIEPYYVDERLDLYDDDYDYD